MSSTLYFLYFVLTLLTSLHQTHGQTCDPDLDYRCVNETTAAYCTNGSLTSDVAPCPSGLYCQDDCQNFCNEKNITCVPALTKTTAFQSSTTTTELTTMPTTTNTESTTELTMETTTTELTSTTTPTTTTTTETTTEFTTEGTSTTGITTTELPTTAMPTTMSTELTTTSTSTTNTTAELTTGESSATELTTTTRSPTAATTNAATSSAPTEAPPTEAPFTCESAGEFQDLGNCSNFYLCIPLSSGDFVYIMFSCPDGSQFDSVTKKCSQNATCITPSCNDFGFYCISTTQVQLCYDSEPPSGDAFTCPTNTYCSMECQYPCWADIPCTVTTESSSTSTEPLPTSTVTLSSTTTEFPSESTTASPTSTITLPQTTTAAPFVCAEAGRFPDPTNCSLYYLCSPKSTGGFYTMHFSCPTPSLYNPSIRQCSNYYTCSTTNLVSTSNTTVTSIVTSTSRPFTCEESGRFADPNDCRSYYLCSPKSSGGFYEMHYQCPSTSAFNQNTSQCSTAPTVNC